MLMLRMCDATHAWLQNEQAQLADMANKRAQEAAGHAEQLAMAWDEACTTVRPPSREECTWRAPLTRPFPSCGGQTRDLRVAKREAVERYNQVNDDCRHWFNQAMTLKGNIRVFCRVRPQVRRLQLAPMLRASNP